ncbi:MAG: AAA family ATPase [Actinobacteria bacterium]|nr:AAA family ATPase [Actinomycetota bacterium]
MTSSQWAPSPDERRLVGRDVEMAQLTAAVAAALTGPSPAVVEVRGEPGIGKSALLDVLASRAAERGLVLVRTWAEVGEQEFPFGLLVSLFDAMLSEPAISAQLDPYDRADLGTVFPSLREFAEEPEGGSIDRHLISRALRSALGVLGGDRTGIAVIVDDFQWADELSRFVLTSLARRGIGSPLLVGYATRSVASGTAGIAIRGDRSDPAYLIDVEPLNSSDAATLLHPLSSDQRELALELAAGNPFYLTQISGHGQVPQLNSGSPATSIPPAVATAIGMDCEGLSSAAQRLLDAAAVLGSPFTSHRAAVLAELTDSQLVCDSIDELLERSLLVGAPNPTELCIRHALVEAVLYESLPQGARLALHRRAAALLTAEFANPLAVAAHLERCATAGDSEAIEAISKAAEGVQGLSPQSAARLYSSAIRLTAEAGPQVNTGVALRSARADCLFRTGRFQQAGQELAAALERTQPEDVETRVTLIAAKVRVEMWLGQEDTSWHWQSRAYEQLPPGPSLQRAVIEVLLMASHFARADFVEAREFAEHARRSTELVEMPWLAFSLTAAVANFMASLRESTTAGALCDEALGLLDRVPEGELPYTVDGLIMLGAALAVHDRHDDTLRIARLAGDLSRRTGNAIFEVCTDLLVSEVLTSRGQLDGASEALEDAWEMAQSIDNVDLQCETLARRSLVAGLRGDVRNAKFLAGQWEELMPQVTDKNTRASSCAAIAQVWQLVGEPGECASTVSAITNQADRRYLTQQVLARMIAARANAALDLTDIPSAELWGDRAQVLADETSSPLARCCALRIRALIQLAQGDAASAHADSAASVAIAERAGDTLEKLQSQLALGRALIARGREGEAADLLTSVASEAVRCGAARFSLEAAHQLRQLGVTPPSSNSVGRSRLTGRESEVARLVLDDLTNQQIAETLYLSVRTVESHVSHILTKLRLSSRKQLSGLLPGELLPSAN